jgi:hypothetical protein
MKITRTAIIEARASRKAWAAHVAAQTVARLAAIGDAYAAYPVAS